MKDKRNGAWAAGMVLLIVAFAGACKDSDVLDPGDSTMTLTASPSRVVFATGDQTPVPVNLAAQVRHSDGSPERGIAVTFSTTAGVLTSAGESVETDLGGVAHDVLTVYPDAPSSIEVTATSGTLTKTVAIVVERNGPAGPAVVRLVPSAPSYRVGDSVVVNVLIESGTGVDSVAFRLRFNRQVLEFVPPAIEGPFLGSDGTGTVFLADEVADGELAAGMSRMGGGEGMTGSGVLATFRFQAVNAGNCGFAFTGASVKDEHASTLPSMFVTAAVQVQP
jgi:hypothetical protein